MAWGLALRLAVAALAWWLEYAELAHSHAGGGTSPLFVGIRWGMGFAGPVLATVLAWQTVAIRSTQSATGILYVDFFTVVVGEVLAKYLLLATRVPV